MKTIAGMEKSILRVSTAIKIIDENSVPKHQAQAKRMAQYLIRYQGLARAAIGPTMNQALLLSRQFQRMHELALIAEQRFHLPAINDAIELLRVYSDGANVMKRYQMQMPALQHSIEAMSTPWLDTENKLRSISGFVALQGIGRALNAMPPFDKRLTDALRIDLGDWRKKVAWHSNTFLDPLARTSFYLERGLNPSLTAFPPNTFEQSITAAGIKRTSTPSTRTDSSHLEEENEAAFKRTNDAHDLLQRFEDQLRRFIDERMEEAFGANWIKHRIPSDMRGQWLNKQRQDTHAQQWTIISYADFTDYVTIITRNDNWQDLFQVVFANKNSVQESFRRLYPIRIATMHARPITQDDELYLYVETKRILTAIGIDT